MTFIDIKLGKYKFNIHNLFYQFAEMNCILRSFANTFCFYFKWHFAKCITVRLHLSKWNFAALNNENSNVNHINSLKGIFGIFVIIGDNTSTILRNFKYLKSKGLFHVQRRIFLLQMMDFEIWFPCHIQIITRFNISARLISMWGIWFKLNTDI